MHLSDTNFGNYDSTLATQKYSEMYQHNPQNCFKIQIEYAFL